MGYKTYVIEGVGPSVADELAAVGIRTSEDLLERCAEAAGRRALSAAVGIGESNILRWSNHSDLMRIEGVEAEYAELLEAGAVSTVRELQNRNADNLATHPAQVNANRKPTRSVPGPLVVSKWIDQAMRLDPVIRY